MINLENKVAIVTGSTSGIGKSCAEKLSNLGAKVVVSGRRTELGESISDSLKGESTFIKADMSEEKDIQNLVTKTVSVYGKLDIMVNNAGIPGPLISIEEISKEILEYMTSTLFFGVVLGTKYSAEVMKKNKSGSIINIGSIAGHLGGYGPSHIYSSLKSAVIHFSKSAGLELADSGIRVNSVSPGAIVTGIFGKMNDDSSKEADEKSSSLQNAFSQAQPIQRAGSPNDIANVVAFLASDESSFVSSADYLVDGGMVGGRQFSVTQERMKILSDMAGS